MRSHRSYMFLQKLRSIMLAVSLNLCPAGPVNLSWFETVVKAVSNFNKLILECSDFQAFVKDI